MRRTITAELAASPAAVYARLATLDGYGEWMDLVSRVEPANADPGDAGPAWWVTLRAAVGPLARSKRLRMVRTGADEHHTLRFERRELDGRRHSPWVLDVAITPADGAGPAPAHASRSTVVVDLGYDGGLWDPLLDRVLGSNVDTAVPRLQALVAGPPR
ncbi:MAG: SRPBCC family protein [Acidimicrobiales bacterium]